MSTRTYVLEGKQYTVPADTSMDELDQYIKGQTAPNLKTGEGMEAQAQQQAGQYLQNRATAPYEQQQAELQQRKNRAVRWQQNNPTPFTNAVALYAPMAAAKSIVGAKLGSKAGGYIGKQISPTGEQYGELIGGGIGGFAGAVPWGSARYSAAKTIINPSTLQPRAGVKLLPWMSNERATALGDFLDPNLPKVRNMTQAADASFQNRIDELAARGKQETLFGQENAAAIKRMQSPLGSPENPDYSSKLPTRLPPSLRSDPFTGEAPAPKIATPGGRATEPLVKTPEEFAAEDSLQKIAEQRAKQRGMQYAGGVRTAGANKKSNQLFPLPWMRDE